MSSRTSDIYRKRMNAKMTPDELVQLIFRIQQERNPSADPGDMTIMIQDDMPLVMVSQDRMMTDADWKGDFADLITKVQGIPGDSIQQALENYLEAVREGEQ